MDQGTESSSSSQNELGILDIVVNSSSYEPPQMSVASVLPEPLNTLPLKKLLSKQFDKNVGSSVSEYHKEENGVSHPDENCDRKGTRRRLDDMPQCNPALSDDMEIDMKKMRGDAIGNTLYSERWIIKILMKLVKWNETEWNDELEQELCCLWDMTLEPDVINFLMENNILKILQSILQSKQEFRATEIFLGILGNMCSALHVRQSILQSDDFLRLLLKLLTLPDALALIQLMRPLKACISEFRYFYENRPTPLVHSCPKANSQYEESMEEAAELARRAAEAERQASPLDMAVLPVMRLLITTELWHPQIAFILSSSRNVQLLKDTLELLDDLLGILLNPDSMSPLLCTPEMVSALVETLKELQQYIDESGSDFTSPKLNDVVLHWTSIIAYFSGSIEGCSVLAEHDEEITEVLCRYLCPELLTRNVNTDSVHFIKSATEIVVHLLPEWHFNTQLFKTFVSILTVLKDREKKASTSSGADSSTTGEVSNCNERAANETDELQGLITDLIWPVEYLCLTMVDDTMNDEKEANKLRLFAAIRMCLPHEFDVLTEVLNRHSIEMPNLT